MTFGLEQEQVRDHEVSQELDVDWTVTVTDRCLQVLDQLLEHFAQDLQLNVTVRGEHVLCNRLICGQHTVESGRVVAAQNAGRLLELTLTDVLSGELCEELVEHLLVLLLGDGKALVPASILCE